MGDALFGGGAAANDAPGGAAGGDLTGTYPNPTVKASVALTGTPTSPTATVGTSSTQVATTAFVTAAHGTPTWTADQQGLLGLTFDPAFATTNVALVSGYIWAIRLALPRLTTISNIIVPIQTAGSTLTANRSFVGVYSSAGVLLGKSTDQSAVFNSAGIKTVAVTAEAGQSLANLGGAPTSFVRLAIMSNGTTPPTLMVPAGQSANWTTFLNMGLTDFTNRVGQAGGGVATALPAPWVAGESADYRAFLLGIS